MIKAAKPSGMDGLMSGAGDEDHSQSGLTCVHPMADATPGYHPLSSDGLLSLFAGTVALWMLSDLAFGFREVSFPGLWAVGAGALVMMLRSVWRRRRVAGFKRQAVAMRDGLHRLKQREFDWRYAEAQKSDALNRFKKDTE